MSKSRLDKNIVEKIAHEIRKPTKYVVEQISKRASRRGISSEAAEILWAKQLGVGTARYQQTLAPSIQQEVRDLLPTIFTTETRPSKTKRVVMSRTHRNRDALLAAIEYLLSDSELRGRCTDLLRAKGNFDRVFREATTVLDDRLKKLAGVTGRKINPADLAAKVLHPSNPMVRLSQDSDEQEGIFLICRGLFLAFRNPTHHQLSDKFTRENALQFCGFVDSMLALLNQGQRAT